MVLLLREVVVGIDPLKLQRLVAPFLAMDGKADLRQHAVHHLVAVVQSELLGPVQVADVRREGGMVLRQIGEIPVREPDAHLLAQFLGDLDVVVANLVPHPSGP